MIRAYSFKVPASTSNLGAGFDALSLALEKYLRVNIEIPSPGPSGRPLPEGEACEIVARGVDGDSIPTTPDNLILRVANSVAAQRNRPLRAFRMTIENEIPLARGMGSSAAAIIAGVTCYEVVAEDRLSEPDIFRYALEFESHPDNLAAALRGGLVATAVAADGEVLIAKLSVAEGVRPILVIPAFQLSTEKARGVLPQTYSRKDAVYNIQRSALTIATLTTGGWTMLREAMRDRVHQPYRAPLIPGFGEILSLNTPGLFGIALSGAGPTVLAFASPGNEESVGRAIVSVFDKHGVKATPVVVNIDTKGRVIADLNAG
jgi:homoserine kinase